MAFMNLYVEHGNWYRVENNHGEGTLLPADLVGDNPELEDFADYLESGEPAEFEKLTGWAARYSAPGYMDCTEWTGVFPTEEAAREACIDIYGDEDETGPGRWTKGEMLMPYTPKHLKRWTRPDNYFGSEWPEMYVFLGRTRDSDALSRSNFQSGLRQIGGETETVQVISENHWAVGWVEWIGIHESDLKALRKADAILESLEDYPVVDEEDLSREEAEEANVIWRDCYDPKERVAYIRAHRSQFDFRDFADLISCVRGQYFAGYASELLA